MKKWERKLVKDFKAGDSVLILAINYSDKLPDIQVIERKMAVEQIIRDWMNR